MCTPFIRNRVIHFIDMQIDFFLALQVHFKTRLHSNSHVKFCQNSIVFNVHYNTCIQRGLTHEQSLLHWINPAPDYVKIIFIEQLDHWLCSSTYQIFDRHSSDNFIGTLGNFITSSPSKVDNLYPGHNLCSNGRMFISITSCYLVLLLYFSDSTAKTSSLITCSKE